MRKATVEADRYAARLRVECGRGDGYAQPELSAVLFVGGPSPELVTVAWDPKVDGADVVYRLVDGVPGHIFEKLVDRGKVTVDCSTGLALVQPPKGGVNGTHLRGGRDRW